VTDVSGFIGSDKENTVMGQLSGPILLSLERNGNGLAIIDGASLRVTWAGQSDARYIGSPDRRITLQIDVTDVLEVKQQQEKIARLERQLADERDRLDRMREITSETEREPEYRP
jgi:hypothetical protein